MLRAELLDRLPQLRFFVIGKPAHPQLITALVNGILSINCAMRLCELPKAEQLERFIANIKDREIGKVIRDSIARPKSESNDVTLPTVLDALRKQEACHPGSVLVKVHQFPHTVILVGRDLLNHLLSQKQLELNEISRSSQTNSASDATPLGPRLHPPFSAQGVQQGRVVSHARIGR